MRQIVATTGYICVYHISISQKEILNFAENFSGNGEKISAEVNNFILDGLEELKTHYHMFTLGMTLRIDSLKIKFDSDRVYVFYDTKDAALAKSIAAKISEFEKSFSFLLKKPFFVGVMAPIIPFSAQVGMTLLVQNLTGRNIANMDGYTYTGWFDRVLHADLLDNIPGYIIFLTIAIGILNFLKNYKLIQIKSSSSKNLGLKFIIWALTLLVIPLLIKYLQYQFGWSK